MEVSYDPEGQAYVSRYEPGDLVLLHASERGEGLAGKVGDWGRVVSVGGDGERIDVEIAGYSQHRHSSLKRLTGIAKRMLVPCDRTGARVPLPPRAGLFRLDAATTRKFPPVR